MLDRLKCRDMTIFLWSLAGYLAIGIFVTWLLSQTPYSDNGWLWMTLLWPLFVWSILT